MFNVWCRLTIGGFKRAHRCTETSYYIIAAIVATILRTVKAAMFKIT